MAATAEKITPIEERKDLVQFSKALVKFDIQEKVLSDLEEAAKLEITDTESEKVVRKHRQNAKSLEVKIEKRRLELNREFKEATDTAAGLISPRVTAAHNKLDEKVKAVEAEREERKAEKERQEAERLASIQAKFYMLTHLAGKPMGYDRSSKDLARDLAHLESFEISAVDFQERTEAAEKVKAGAIETAKKTLENRKKFEAEQAEVARVKAEQEAEVKRLEKERARFEADRKAKEEADKKAAEAESEIRRQEQEALKAEREAIEAEKERIRRVQIDFESIPKKVDELWDDPAKLNGHSAYLFKFPVDPEFFKERTEEFKSMLKVQLKRIKGRLHEHAISDHEDFRAAEQAEIYRLKADAKTRWEATEKAKAEAAARAKLLAPDKKKIQEQINLIDTAIPEIKPFDFATEEAAQLVTDLYIKIKTALEEAEKAGIELV